MKKFKYFTIGGIQQKIFNLVLITLLLTMVAYTAVIIHQSGSLTGLVSKASEEQKASIADISEQTMHAVLDTSLTQSTKLEAHIAGEMFGNAAKVVRIIADYTGRIFADPAAYPSRAVSLPNKDGDGEISAQLLTEAGINLSDPTVSRKLGLIGNLTNLMTAVYAEANVDSCYVALPEGVMLLVDDHPGTKFDADGKLVPIPMRERLWYTGAAETGELYYTDVTTDLFTGEISIMCSLPVYRDGELVAVVGADLFLNDMAAAVNSLARDGSFVCIVNQNGHVVFSPRTEGAFRTVPDGEAQDVRESGNEELKTFVTDALAADTGMRLIEVDGEPCYVVGEPIQSVGWAILCVVPKALADQPSVAMKQQYDAIQGEAAEAFEQGMGKSRTTIFVLLAVVVLLVGAAALILAKRIVKPLETMSKRVLSLNENDLQFRMEPTYRTGDEIEVLAESFAMLSEKTVQYISEVQRVTAEKERIGTELALATRIQSDMLPNIYPAFPERKEFDIYASMDPAKEVGGDFYDFFLVDDDHLCMVVADVSGKGVPAALFMMASKIVLANNAMLGKSPAKILTDTNAAICSKNREEMFVTVWLGVLELSTGKLTAANAGHEYPMLMQPGGDFELVKDKHGFVIGGMEGARYREYELTLQPGAKIFLYTDGVPEATSTEQELFGTDRTLAALNADTSAAPEKLLRNVRAAVDAFVKDAEQFDDLTMLCLEYRGPQNA
ncbi:MAG: SpoIIE family protein phosphatase [Oscillibacter sp.]|nr:SpoIIE family protein phosphatase [Oscillibacter sp.]